jgi:hypothetical protein
MKAVWTVWREEFHKPGDNVRTVSMLNAQRSNVPSSLGRQLVEVVRIQFDAIWGSFLGVDLSRR